MNRAFFLKKEARQPKWIKIDARGKVLGRLATEIADILRGKHKPQYTPHTDAGDYVVVINAQDIVLTGNKWQDKQYEHYTGWIGNLKVIPAYQMKQKHPTHIIELAVKRMLPKSIMGRAMFKKLRVYVGENHPHHAQVS